MELLNFLLFNTIIVIIVMSIMFYGINKMFKQKINYYIQNQVKFQFRENPNITCTIYSFNFNDKKNNRMSLIVFLPRKSFRKLNTNYNMFYELWEKQI